VNIANPHAAGPSGKARAAAGVAVLLAMLAGCATAPDSPARPAAGLGSEPAQRPSACAEFAEQRKTLRYATIYRLAPDESESAARNFRPLPPGEAVRVRHYTLRFDREDIAPCHHLMMRKELYLQRSAKSALRFQETREFYAGDGTLIAIKNEALDQQLGASGYYLASVPLPIPQNAPAGKYRVVTKLLMQNQDGKAQLLAFASANFTVTAAPR
jgi:hypothetical protein